jgi:hypothetical protein
LVNPTTIIHAIPEDPDDNRVLECAVEVRSLFIVTGDADLLRLGQYGHFDPARGGPHQPLVNPPSRERPIPGDLTAETALARGVKGQLQTKEGSSLSAALYLRYHRWHHRVDLAIKSPTSSRTGGRGGILPRIAKRDRIRRKSTEGRQDRAKAVGRRQSVDQDVDVVASYRLDPAVDQDSFHQLFSRLPAMIGGDTGRKCGPSTQLRR